jgi:DNA replication and repair protein RecF
MHVTRLKLTNFRNYRALDLAPPPGLVVLVGDNAQGKTNLLEALFYLSTSRSPRTSRDAELIGWQAAESEQRVARAEATVQRRDRTVTLDITVMGRGQPAAAADADDSGIFVAPAPGTQKRIRVNGVPRRAIDLLGNLPVALFRPEDVDLVSGAPAARRRSLDILISQVEPRYPRALQRYARTLTQRNHLLRRIAERGATVGELEPWNDLLVRDGALVIAERLRTLARLSPLSGQAHGLLSNARDRLTMAYEPAAGPALEALIDTEAAAATFLSGLEAATPRDVAIGQTTVGPHRDDVTLLINGAPAASYGSRGQQRTIALSWRLAEAEYLREAGGEAPVVLLDDVLSELDTGRRAAVLRAMAGFDQVFLTTTGAELTGAALAPAAVYRVHQGALQLETGSAQ